MARASRSRYSSRVRRLALSSLALLIAALAVAAWSYRLALSDPVVRRATVALPGWPAGAQPVRVALASDIHLGNGVTDVARLARIVDRVNGLRPDLVLLAGDFIAGDRPEDAAAAPDLAELGRLDAPLGVVAVPGNHEHWTDARRVRRVLEEAGVTVLANTAVRRGPLAVGGLDDMVTGHARFRRTAAAARRAGGARVILSHTPDAAPLMPDDMTLLLAGHTHCGQVVLPFWGPLAEMSRHGSRYRCGLVREGGRTVIVTAGTGTSAVPFRFGAPPDLWLLTLGP